MDKVNFIAKCRYLAWQCYQRGAGIDSNELTTDQLESLCDGVEFILKHPNATAEENHINWMNCKLSQGWVYGEEKDLIKKTHPSLIPFNELSKFEADKDIMDAQMTLGFEKIWNELQGGK
jgi:hypothetical protein